MLKQILLIASFFAVQTGIQAQTIDTTLWSVSGGDVNVVVKDGNTLYVGGSFTTIGPNIGCWAAFGQSDGAISGHFPIIKAGNIATSIEDGNGGWFVGGFFSFVNGQTYANLIHVKPDGTLDVGFNPSPNSWVRTLSVYNGKLYMGGEFSTVAGQDRSKLASIDIATGFVTTWNPTANSNVQKMVRSGSRLYVCGAFSGIGSQIRNRLACFNLASGGTLAGWNPDMNNDVNAMVLDGGLMYVGGRFTMAKDSARNRLAALDTLTGIATNWNPDVDQVVNALALSGTRMYVGGNYTMIGNAPHSRLAAIDLSTGFPIVWSPNPDNAINTIAVGSGGAVYVGGSFNTIAGQARRCLAGFDDQGVLSSWDPKLNNIVYHLRTEGTNVFAGGIFNSANEVIRNRLAAIDLSTGQPTAWDPGPDNTVRAIVATPSAVYVGGSFAGLGGLAVPRLAALNKATGIPTSWNPNPNGDVYSLLLKDDKLIVGGAFTIIGTQGRQRLAEIELASGNATAWNPSADGIVNTLHGNASHIFVGGAFTNAGGSARNRIASFNRASGTLTGWNPNADNTVNTIKQRGSHIYLGGAFMKIGLITRKYIASLDTTSNLPDSWDPSANGTINSIEISDTILYAGGAFSGLGGFPRAYLGALNILTAVTTDWNPAPGAAVNSICLSADCNGEKLYAGGNFNAISNKDQRKLAGIINSILPGIVLTPVITNETCLGSENGSIAITPAGGTAPYTYAWSNQDDAAAITELAGGNYTVTVRDTSGCARTQTFTVESSDQPVAEASFDFVVNGTEVTFTDMSEGAPDMRLWAFGDDQTSTDVSPVHTFSGDSIFQVCLTVVNACGTDSVCREVRVTGVGFEDQDSWKNNVAVFPNPTTDHVQIRTGFSAGERITVCLVDLTGRTVVNAHVVNASAAQLDLSRLNAGIYMLKLTHDELTTSLRINKQ